MKIKILNIIGQIGVGGCEKQLLELCSRLDKDTFEIGICYYSPVSVSLADDFEAVGVQLFFVNRYQLSPIGFFKALRDVIHDYRPNVINTWLYSANLWGRAAAISCGYRNMIACDRSFETSYNFFYRCFERIASACSTWVANSYAISNRLTRVLGVPPERVRVIHNAVEFELQDRQICRLELRKELGFAPDQPLVLAVGRLTDAKNYSMLFKVAKEVISNNEAVRFIVAGHGELEQELQDLKNALGLGEHLIMLGLRSDVPRLLAATDVFCMTSWFEGFPNAVAEAMYAGLPVVCTRFVGADEVVKDGLTGYLVDVDDIPDYSDKVIQCLNYPDQSTSMGVDAAVWVRENLSWVRVLREMESIYRADNN